MKLLPTKGAIILLTILAAAIAVIAIMSGCTNGARATRTDQRSVEHLANTPIVVQSRNGHVQVTGDDDITEVMIEAEITTGGRTSDEANDRLSQTRLEVTRDTAGTLTIAMSFPTPNRSGDGASITVRVPDASSVSITTSNGGITASGMDATLTASSSNGRITVNDWTGDANLTTSNGRIMVSNLAGELTARTTNGRVQVDDLDGPAEVRTSNGRIALTLAADQSGPIDLQTSNGAITAEVGPAFAGSMTLRTSNSSISIDDAASIASERSVERRRAELVFTDDGPASRLSTSNGRITLRTRD